MRRWWPAAVRHSTALSASLLCLALIAIGWLGARTFLEQQFEHNEKSKTITELRTMAADYQVAAREGSQAPLRVARMESDALFEVVAESGQSVVRSPLLRHYDPAWKTLPPAPTASDPRLITTTVAELKPGTNPAHWREYRTYTVLGLTVEDVPSILVEPFGREGLTLGDGLQQAGAATRHRLTLYVLVKPWERIKALSTFDFMLSFFGPLAVLFTAVSAWFSVRRALRPVEAIRQVLAEISGHRLDRRVPVPRSDDEIARLAQTTNSTLERLQISHQQQENFVADASHELRSPLANLRTGLEVALTHPDRADWPGVAQSALLDVQRLQRITADLLQLATDSTEASRCTKVVDVADIVVEQVAERSTSLGPVKVRYEVDGPVLVAGNSAQLERLLRNLLDNAVRHADSSVTVRVGHAGGVVVLEVQDDGPGIPVSQRERVFDRFARLDDARARDAGGSGLGLALARDIVSRHGGSLCVEDSAVGARMVARLPVFQPQ